MPNNLHISYDLYAPGQRYDAVAAAIKSLGSWAKIHKSFWFVSSAYTPVQARDIVWRAMDANDSLYVVDARTNDAAWMNLDKVVEAHIKRTWTRR